MTHDQRDLCQMAPLCLSPVSAVACFDCKPAGGLVTRCGVQDLPPEPVQVAQLPQADSRFVQAGSTDLEEP